MIVAVVVLAVVFAALSTVTVLRFSVLLRQLVDSVRLDKLEHAQRLEQAHTQAFADAMTALQSVQDRVSASQSQLLERTMDAVAGPQGASQEPFKVDDPSLDARARWVPDDEWDYSGLGIDPTDDEMPLPRLEPEGNAHRAVMVPPGQGLAPN